MICRRRLPLFWYALAALSLPLGAPAQEARVGNEFQVNTYTTGQQRFSSVAADADGDFVVIWESYNGQDGSGHGVFAQSFSSAGVPLAGEFQVNTFTPGYQRSGSVATDTDGDFVIAWWSQQDGSDFGIFARRFSSAGVPLVSEFQVNTYTSIGQRQPSVAASASGDFVVVWQSFPNQDGSGYGIFGRAFSSAGNPLASEFQVNTYTQDYQRYAAVAADDDLDFVVVWASRGQDGSSYGIFARRFSSAGTALAGEFQVNTYTTGQQSGGNRGGASVAMDSDGDFVVAWSSDADQDGSSSGVFARRFSSAGAALASEFQVNTHTVVGQDTAWVTTSAAGDFVVTWHSNLQDGSDSGIFARRFSSAGVRLATEFQVNTYTPGQQRNPAVAASAAGDFVVVWQDFAKDGSGEGIFGQRFAALAALDIDGNGATQPLTDGLLVLRYLFEFSGATLTNGAVDLVDCKRCDAVAIEPYIAGLGLVLDIDGNTSLGPLTDGLLVLRFLFGFTGSTLTNGAVGQPCTRCDAATIEPYLEDLAM